MRKLEFTYEAVSQLAGFFRLMGFETYAKKLTDGLDALLRAQEDLINKGYDMYNFEKMHNEVDARRSVLERTLKNMRDIFNLHLEKITIAPPEEATESAEDLALINNGDPQ